MKLRNDTFTVFRFLVPAAIALFALRWQASAGDVNPAVHPRELAMELTQISKPLLPLQPVRLLLTVRNRGTARVGPLFPVDDLQDPLIKFPNSAGYVPSRALDNSFSRSTVVSPPSWLNIKVALYLEANEQSSVSFAIGRRSNDINNAGPRAALFERPGKYQIKCGYISHWERQLRIEKDITVEVAEPTGDDLGAFTAISKDAELMNALLEPNKFPDKKLIPKLQAIVELFGDSSYADYVRFALARHYLQSNGFQLKNSISRVDRALAADQLDKVRTRDLAYAPNVQIARREADPLSLGDATGIAAHVVLDHRESKEWIYVYGTILAQFNKSDVRFIQEYSARQPPDEKSPDYLKALAKYQFEIWRDFRKCPAKKKSAD